MTKRHLSAPGDWELIIGRLEELVLANSGEDEFEEVFKILVAKLFAELASHQKHRFEILGTPSQTAHLINRLLAHAADRWPGILPTMPISKLTDEHLAICVEAIQEYTLVDSNLEVLDALFEYLVSKSAKGSKGQYFTPRNVVDCCINILQPKPSELIADPACGSAGFLIHAIQYVKENYKPTQSRKFPHNFIWGFDFDLRAIQVAKALMLIAGDGHSNLFRLNSLVDTEHTRTDELFSHGDHDGPRLTIEEVMRTRVRGFRGFDVIVTNPPFAGEIRETKLLDSYELAKKNRRIERDILFLERCARLLVPGGRIAIVLPHNKLGSENWSYAREWFMRNVQIVGVLGLERNTFLPHTHQKAGVVFGIKRPKPLRTLPRDEKILFLLSGKSGKDTKGKIIAKKGSSPTQPMWFRAEHDLSEAVEVFQTFVRQNKIAWA